MLNERSMHSSSSSISPVLYITDSGIRSRTPTLSREDTSHHDAPTFVANDGNSVAQSMRNPYAPAQHWQDRMLPPIPSESRKDVPISRTGSTSSFATRSSVSIPITHVTYQGERSAPAWGKAIWSQASSRTDSHSSKLSRQSTYSSVVSSIYQSITARRPAGRGAASTTTMLHEARNGDTRHVVSSSMSKGTSSAYDSRASTIFTLPISSYSSSSSIASSVRLTEKFPMPRARSIAQRSHPDTLPHPSTLVDTRGVATTVITPGQLQTWTKSKWLLLTSVAAVFAYGLFGLVLACLTWLRTWDQADVLLVVENHLMIAITLSGVLCIMTAFIGLAGTLLNSRPILAVYVLLLWPALVSILVVGYMAFKKQNLNLDRKLNQAWSQFYDDSDRWRIQTILRCCGYYNAMHEATYGRSCYPRSILPGCKGKLFRFEKQYLHRIATTAFSIVPIHIACIFIALLCSNHVDTTFAKRLMPRPYRLSMTDVRENAIALLQTLPEQPRDAVVASVAHDHGSSGHGSSRSIVSSRRRRQNSVSTLASMPQRRGQTGLGLGLRAT